MITHIQRTTFKVSDFISWQKHNMLILNPKFQRRSVWSPGAKSYLIDTIIRGLPIPVIILRDIKTDLLSFEAKKEVVDGQQRLRTIISYVVPGLLSDEPFTVRKIHNQEAGGKEFNKLSEGIKQKILDYEFFVHVLPSNVSDREILEIFSRMNSTGYKLKAQELRNAKFFGEFKTTVYGLALEYYDKWLKWEVFTDAKIARMDEVELVNDLFIIVLYGIQKRSPESIDIYYEKYEEPDSFKEREEVISRIRNTLNYIDELIGNDLRKLLFKKIPLFYSLFAVLYDLRYGLHSELKKKNPIKLNSTLIKENILKVDTRFVKLQNIPEHVFISYTKGTNTLNARETVFNFLRKEITHGI